MQADIQRTTCDVAVSYTHLILNKDLDKYRICIPLCIRPISAAGQKSIDALEKVKIRIRDMGISLVNGQNIIDEYPDLKENVKNNQPYVCLLYTSRCV